MAISDEIRSIRDKTVRDHMEAENRLDFAAALATFGHPRYELIATGQVHDGRDAVEGYFRDSRSAFPDQRNEVIAMHHADDGVIVEFWLMGTHKGQLGPLAPTGRSFRSRMAAFFLFEGSDLVCERIYFDTAGILRQLTE